MSAGEGRPGPRHGEFVAMIALMISLVALSIDSMLPALQQIGAELGVRRPNDAQFVISALLLGLATGTMLYGPVSDSTGRKPPIYAGFALFIVGSVLSVVAASFPAMLAGRFLQGLGAAGPRIVAVALVRDRFGGRAMARVMSTVMAVFILVPAVAPAFGQAILLVAHWRAIFGLLLALALVVWVWFAVRQPETLAAERRAPFSLLRIGRAVRETCGNRTAFGYTIAAGLVFGALFAFINLAQQVLQGQYGLGTQFPLYFAALVLALGAASVLNARLVMRLGMRLLSKRALQVLCVLSAGFFAVSWAAAGQPPLWALMAYLMPVFFCFGVMFGNFNALAMEPLGHIAGVAASVVGALTTFVALLLGAAIGQAYDGTVLPLIGGFAVLGLAGLAAMHWAER